MSCTRGSLPAISSVPVMLLQGFKDICVEAPAETRCLLDLVLQLRHILESRRKPVGKTAPFLEIGDDVFVSVLRSNDLAKIVGAELLYSLALG
jgi:hypothetical protein